MMERERYEKEKQNMRREIQETKQRLEEKEKEKEIIEEKSSRERMEIEHLKKTLTATSQSIELIKAKRAQEKNNAMNNQEQPQAQNIDSLLDQTIKSVRQLDKELNESVSFKRVNMKRGASSNTESSGISKLVNKGYSFVKQNGALFSTILFGSAAWYASQ